MKLLLWLFLLFVTNNVANKTAEKYNTPAKKRAIIHDFLVGTIYHPVKGQTDNSPLITADYSKIDLDLLSQPNGLRWVALSRDLLNERDWEGNICYGDTIYVESDDERLCGSWVVHDTMNKRYTDRIDFLQPKGGIYGKWDSITIKVERDERI